MAHREHVIDVNGRPLRRPMSINGRQKRKTQTFWGPNLASDTDPRKSMRLDFEKIRKQTNDCKKKRSALTATVPVGRDFVTNQTAAIAHSGHHLMVAETPNRGPFS